MCGPDTILRGGACWLGRPTPVPSAVETRNQAEKWPTTTWTRLLVAAALGSGAAVWLSGVAAHATLGSAAGIVPVGPARVYDTREQQPTVDGAGSGDGAFAAGETRRIQISGRADVPVGAVGVAATVTAAEAPSAGYLTVFDCGQRPRASNVSYPAGAAVAGATIARLDAEGGMCVFARSAVHVVVDVSGFFAGGAEVTPVGPARIADTRLTQQLDAGATLEVPVGEAAGLAGLADGAPAAVVVSVTATQAEAAGHLTVHACGRARPHASVLNYHASSANVTNLAWTPLSEAGSLCVYSLAAVHVIVDLVAVVRHGAGIEPAAATRLADSRAGRPTIDGRQRGFGPVGRDRVVRIDVAGRGAVNRRAVAAAMTLTITEPVAAGHATVYPCDQPRPLASNVNFRAGETVAATVWSGLSRAGAVCVYTYASTQLVVDVAAALAPWSPTVAAAGSHSCSVSAGSVDCWGSNDSGQLGDGTTIDRGVPARVAGIADASAVALGGRHTCAVLDDRRATCWGYNAAGQLGDDSLQSSTIPRDVALPDPVAAIAAGDFHTCALTVAGDVWCWGDNSFGQLGRSGSEPDAAPAPVPRLGPMLALSAAGDTTCALSESGSVWCWGYNGDGQLGGDTSADRSEPAPIVGPEHATGLSVGYRHVCATTVSGEAWCWGANDRGQLGNSTIGPTSSPVQVLGFPGPVAALAAGSGEHTCALVLGDAWCWGANERGQLGVGDSSDRTEPAEVVGPSGLVTVTAGDRHTCARAAGGAVWCWGANDFGQLGNGSLVDASRPVEAE